MCPFSSAIVDLTTVIVAGDQLTRDEVCSRAVVEPWVVVELPAPLLWFGRRPELNGSRCTRASYDEDSWGGVGGDVGGGHHGEGVDEDND